MICELGHQHMGRQAGSSNSLVNDVWHHRRLHQRLALFAHPFAAHMALNCERARLVIELLGNVLADAL